MFRSDHLIKSESSPLQLTTMTVCMRLRILYWKILYIGFFLSPLQMGYNLDPITTGKPRVKLVNTFIVFKMLDMGGK